MRNFIKLPVQILLLPMALAMNACLIKNQPLAKLQNNFTHIPDTVQTSIYWYWISDNISKEGVVRDLESMKKIGINRAFIGNIWQDEVPAGKAKIFTPEWWDILRAALKKATELDIEIGLFNSPGWSQSGGPWIKPEQSMRFLASSKMFVKGPLKFIGKLNKPSKDFQDVKLIAYPTDENSLLSLADAKPETKATPRIENLKNLTDGNDSTVVTLKGNTPYLIDIIVSRPYAVRSIVILPRSPMTLNGSLQAEEKGAYKTIKTFAIDRSNTALNVGFSPYGPAAFALPETTASRFRILIDKFSADCRLAEIMLSPAPAVENYIEKTLAKMWQNPFPYWDAYLWAPAPEKEDYGGAIDPKKVVDISARMAADGTLTWDVPKGNWVIERSGMSATGVTNAPASPEGTGLETDKMSKKHIQAHFDAYLGEIIRRIPAEERKTWRVTVEDSYETGGQNWTDDFIEEFKNAYRYDPVPYIPVMQGSVVGSAAQSDRFLWDVRRLVADNVAYKYVGGLREVSHRHGLKTWLENYGHWGFPAEFLQYGGQSDEVGGEFWSEGGLGNVECRAASSAAHIYGKTKVSAESFTCAGAAYSRYPAQMKSRADRFFTEGINNTLLHVYISQPDRDKAPGLNAWFGNEFNRMNTWFYDMDIFLKYIKRCNMMLQQGKYVADAAYFIGEDTPKMTGTQSPELPKGYSFDYINAEVINTRLAVKEGRLTLPDGMSYSLLVLPPLQTIRPKLLQKIKELVQQGATILGPKPLQSPSLENYPSADEEVRRLADELWGTDGKTQVNRLGKGMVLSDMDMQQAFDLLKIKTDFKASQTDSVLFIHRDLREAQLYFISNQKNKEITMDAEFRVNNLAPEWWDPVTGSTREIEEYTVETGLVKVPVKLFALESAFIVFCKKAPENSRKAVKHKTSVIDIDTPWLVKFDEKSGGPAEAVKFETLTDWSRHPMEAIKYYSGTAVYHNEINWQGAPKGSRIYLDLGMVKAIAKIKINGAEMGGVWTAPYKIDVASALKKGLNKLEIKVVNTWVNRLIGDSRLPASERKTQTVANPYNSASPLHSSGLLGPVKIEIID